MHLHVGELAEKCSVNKETIRYYERIGLISKPIRSDSGYRIYSELTVDRLNFIKRMQELGFTLKEIIEFTDVFGREETRCQDIYDITVKKLGAVQCKLQYLKRIEQMLVDLKERCPENKAICSCPIIEELMKK
ncbi:Hg(II)-responsive transcriptional regulator [Paenibacillus agricola]|uniref:Mercuric resistance operon regulatory protein n=1 Tax=Paenibacillus agricola TaxID=2716264 RepID=A0ABX0J5B5_9BACL|nr:Hg(II)-responsive transcriptional regulator [Paenibacillus agricola]NHN30349.1 Hg(II)-responsive transcriptional regulator [Paenibacillus agricola]